MNGFRHDIKLIVLLLVHVAATAASAKDATVETVLQGLQAPRGVAVRPGANAIQYEIFVSDSARIVKVLSDQPNKSVDVITGFAAKSESSEKASPVGLYFLDANRLVVGCGSDPAVQLFELTEQTTAQPANEPSQELTGSDVETVYSFARTQANNIVPDMLVATCAGRNWRHGLAKIPVRAGTLGELAPLAASDLPANLDLPTAVAINDRGYIVVAQTDSTAGAKRGFLNFLNPVDGSQVMSVPVKLANIVGLAYHPQTGNLYAIDSSSENEIRGGVFRIDEAGERGKPATQVKQIAPIRRPTAMAFGPDGALYVTASDNPNSGANGRGKLFRITGDL